MSIRLTMFVSPMGGHDVNRIAAVLTRWMQQQGRFAVTLAGECPGAAQSIDQFMADEAAVRATQVFLFLCPDDLWSQASRSRLEQAVRDGAGIVFYHGLHPCFQGWPEAEKMIGLLWRDTALHGDYGPCRISIADGEHPITRGVTDFSSNDEIFCRLTNVWQVPMQVLATAYSDSALFSRWGVPGTGQQEPILTTGSYGNGRTVNFLLGHVWHYYTGHGLLENTLAALEPPQFCTLLLRSCEWAATGQVAPQEHTEETER